jgi:hypothetical protein
MATLDEESYVRQSVIITFLWLLAMLVGGIMLLQFGDVIQNLFA